MKYNREFWDFQLIVTYTLAYQKWDQFQATWKFLECVGLQNYRVKFMYMLLTLLIEGIKDAWKVLSSWCLKLSRVWQKTLVSHNLDNQFIKQNKKFYFCNMGWILFYYICSLFLEYTYCSSWGIILYNCPYMPLAWQNILLEDLDSVKVFTTYLRPHNKCV